ncbi:MULTISPECIES: glycosyltransferase [Polaromonas]|uniref:Glycosyltransferase n=1 Tax=Polaromonas aquatica TaxID=332657 RepID=A0ABW1U0V3_9BURK
MNASADPLVSIVIPVYNGSNYLAEAIESALSQTYSNIEILVINDGSTDDGKTERVAQSYGSRIRYFSKENGGVASALNMGIEKMAGSFFSWLSHDDLFVSEKIVRQMDALAHAASSESICYSNYYVFTDDPADTVPISLKGVPPEHFRYWLTVENVLHGCTLLIPKAAFTTCGTFNTSLRTTQDYDLWFRMAKKFAFVHVPEMLVKARSHAHQDSHKLAGTALKECDALLSGFVAQLGIDELKAGSGQPGAVSYARVAASMRSRGFVEAGLVATKLCIKHLSGESPYTKVLALFVLTRGALMQYITKPIKGLIPPSVRSTIRQWLAGGTKKGPPGAETVRGMGLKEKFSEVYDKNIFRGSKSRSGEGSDLVQTAVIRREMPRLLRELGIKTLLDAPCGDWYWMRHMDLPVDRYIGADIVEALVAKNREEFGSEKIGFECIDLAEGELPKADLIFSRDCLVHLSFADALKIIANFKRSGATYLLTTTFTARTSNEDLGTGFWRPLNKQLSPFNFPAPMLLINEECTEGLNMFTDKCLGLWKLQDINLQ